MKVTHKVKVDMERREYPVHIDVVQMDANTRVLEVSLFSGGVPWNVPSDASVSLAFKKADGHGGWYDTLPSGENAFVVDGNVVNVTLAPEVTTFAGRVALSLVMQNPETLDQIASFPMVLMVAENPANGQQLSNDYFNYKTMTEVNKAIDAFAKQIGSFDGSLRPIDFTLTATNSANNNWSSIRDLPTNRIYRLPYNDHPVDFGMPYSGSKQSLLAVIGTGNTNWYTLYICADRDGTIWMAYDDPASSDDVKWVSLGDDPVDVQKHLYDLSKRGQTVARFRGTHVVNKKIKIPASMTVIGGEFIAGTSFEDAIFSADGDGCRLVNVTMKAPALDKTPHIFEQNGVATEAKDSNVIGLYSSGHNGLGMINCVMDKIIPMRINGGSMEVRGCKVTDCSMFVWATDCRITVADNEVSICDTGLDSYYHVYYLDKNAELVASNNRIRCDTTIAYWCVYHFMTAGNKGEYRATGVVDGDVVFGNFQRIIDTHYADLVLKNCKISNSNTEKWSEFQNLAHIKCRFEGCDLDYTGSVMSDRDLSAYPDAEIVYDCCKIMLDDSLNRNRCYLRSDIVQRLDGVPALRDNSDVILCSFSVGGSPVGFVDENKYSTSSMSGDVSIVGENGFSGKIIGNVVEFVDSPTNKELFVFKKFSGAVANNTFFGTNKGVISGTEYDGVFNNYIDGVGVFGNVDEQEVQRIVVNYLKDNPSAGGSVDEDAVERIVEAYLAENPPSGLEPTTDSTEQASYGGELATSNGWTSAGWTGTFASGFTHTSGNTSPLIFAMPEDTGTNIYRVSFKCSASIAVQAIMVRCGNSTLFDLYGQAADPIVLGIQSVSNGDVEFVPASDFTGTISEISIKRVLSDFESVHTMIDSNGDTSFEIRATKASQGNLFVGKNSGRQNVSGYGCVALGANALENNTSGFWNSALGKDCLLHNTAGSRNIAIGYNSLRDNEVGQRNIAIGTFTMTQMKAGNWNIAIGADSMNVSTGGNKNTAVGFNTLTHNESDNNVAFGADVLAQNTTGGNNTAIGARAMTANTSGADSVAIGSGALQKNTSGSWNTAVGNTALYNLTTGQKNVAIGTGAGKSLTTGKRCIAIGQFADLNATEDDQLNIGNVIKGSLDTTSPYVSIDGGLRLPIIPTTYSGDDPVVWNNGGVLMIGTGGMDTIIQAVNDLERVSRYMTDSAWALKIDSVAKTVTVPSGMLACADWCTPLPEQTVAIVQDDATTLVVYDSSADAVRSVRFPDYTGKTMYVIAAITRDRYAEPNANYVQGSYMVDGVLVGGRETGDYIPAPATAQVGQTIVVKEVDDDGKPVGWECADLAGGDKWELIESGEITDADAVFVEFTGLDKYSEIAYGAMHIRDANGKSSGLKLYVNGVHIKTGGNYFIIYNQETYPTINIRKIGKNHIHVTGCGSNLNGPYNVNPYFEFSCPIPRLATTIQSVKFEIEDKDVYFTPGSTYELWGRV